MEIEAPPLPPNPDETRSTPECNPFHIIHPQRRHIHPSSARSRSTTPEAAAAMAMASRRRRRQSRRCSSNGTPAAFESAPPPRTHAPLAPPPACALSVCPIWPPFDPSPRLQSFGERGAFRSFRTSTRRSGAGRGGAVMADFTTSTHRKRWILNLHELVFVSLDARCLP